MNIPTGIPALHNIDYVVNEGHRLLDKPKGAVGRSLRRFVVSQADVLRNGRLAKAQFELDVTVRLHQVFCHQGGFTPEQFAVVTEYAQQVFEKNKSLFPETLLFDRAVTLADAETGTVQNVYELKVDPYQASVATLRMLVEAIVVLANNLRDIAYDINRYVLHSVAPDYVFRNLSCADGKWSIGGQNIRGGSGVLEWCLDLADAQMVLDRMRQQPARFLNLSIYDENCNLVAT